MTKTILTLSTALVLAAGAFASAAEAGSCGGGGGYRSSGHSYRAAPARSAYSVRASKPRSVAQSSSSSSRKTAVAAAEQEVRRGAPVTTSVAAIADKAVPLAEPAVAALDAAIEPADTEARDLGCRRFIPAAGLTISVACGE